MVKYPLIHFSRSKIKKDASKLTQPESNCIHAHNRTLHTTACRAIVPIKHTLNSKYFFISKYTNRSIRKKKSASFVYNALFKLTKSACYGQLALEHTTEENPKTSKHSTHIQSFSLRYDVFLLSHSFTFNNFIICYCSCCVLLLYTWYVQKAICC